MAERLLCPGPHWAAVAEGEEKLSFGFTAWLCRDVGPSAHLHVLFFLQEAARFHWLPPRWRSQGHEMQGCERRAVGGQSLVDRQPMEGGAQTSTGWGCLHSGAWS